MRTHLYSQELAETQREVCLGMLRVAVVGCGWAGEWHAVAISRHQGAELCAVVDEEESKAKTLSAKHQVPWFASLSDLLKSSVQVDAVSICTMPASHVRLSVECIEAGKHVFCEKPLCRDRRETTDLVDALKESDVRFGVNYNQRHSPLVRELAQKMQSEGGAHVLHAEMHQQGPVSQSERINDYFLLTDSCCHIIDTLVFLNGPIQQVFAMGARLDRSILSDVTANIRFSNGSLGSFEHSFVGARAGQHPFHLLDVTTAKARHVLHDLYDGLHTYPHDEMQATHSRLSVFSQRSYGDSMVRSVHSWLDRLGDDEPAETGLAASMHNLDVVAACIESIESGNVVDIANSTHTL